MASTVVACATSNGGVVPAELSEGGFGLAVKRPSGDGASIGIAVEPAAPPPERHSAADWTPLRDISVAPVARGRRGWVVRRMLLAADLAGLFCAFDVTELLFRSHGGPIGGLGASFETAVFVAQAAY